MTESGPGGGPGDAHLVRESGATRNEQRGAADHVLQARDIHGDVHMHGGRRAWLLAAAVLGLALVVAAVIVAWPSTSPHAQAGPPPTTDSLDLAPADLRVTADLSANDTTGPWAYVSDSPTFPGPELLAELSRPRAAVNPQLAARVRTAPGAFAVHTQIIRLQLEGPRDHSVRVTDIRPVIRTTRPVPRGSLLAASSQGSETSAQVLILLDDPFPTPREAVENSDGSLRPGGPYFPAHTINLDSGETSDVVIHTRAGKQAYEYDLVVVYQVGDQLHQMVVNDHGQPFRISGALCPGPGVGYQADYELADDFSLQRSAPFYDPSLPQPTDCAR